MKVILINPNSTEAMTFSSVETAQNTSPEINFEGWTSFDGPPSIQGPEDGKYAIKPLLRLIKKANEEQEFHSNNLKKSYKLDEDYKLLIAELGSISATLAAYRDLKEKLLLDAAQDLSSWNVIGSNIKCSYFKFITFLSIYSFLYLFIILYFENKSIRNLVKDIFIKLKENF